MRRADRDLVALGIAFAAILMFLGTGGSVLPKIARSWMGMGDKPDVLLVNALILNVALIIFGWRRYRELVGEIDERRQAEETARHLAETDPLTGCLNRRSIAEATDELIQQEAETDGNVAMLMVDLDNFKQINDLHGHASGDEVLKVTAQRFAELIPAPGIVARLGGDEFACVVPCSAKHADDVDHLTMKVIDAVSRPITVNDVPLEITVSVGIATNFPSKLENATEADAKVLMHEADIAMYQAKNEGKNRYFWFEPEMENELRYRHQLEQGIRKGIEQGEFVPYYEQQVDLVAGELAGFEMLARWQSPELGIVNPTVFIPVAEEMGVIAELSEGLIAQALEDAKEWDPRLTLSINISPVQLRDPWFSQKLLKLLVEHSFPPNRLEIEITESCLHDNVAMVRSMISSLRNQGIQVSLDDFGTGYSCLSQLKSLPFDRLKIDRSFVTEMRESGAGEKIVDAIIRLGEGLEMPVTAEGIEDNEILDTLKRFGKMKGQGYLYGRPENAAAVRKRLAEIGRLAHSPEPDTSDTAKHSSQEDEAERKIG